MIESIPAITSDAFRSQRLPILASLYSAKYVVMEELSR